MPFPLDLGNKMKAWNIYRRKEWFTSVLNSSAWITVEELMPPRLPKSSHGLHQTTSGLRPRFSSKTRFCKFSAAGAGWGQHLGLPPSPAARTAPNLQAGAPPPSQARAQGQFVAAVRGGRTKPQIYVTPPRQQPGQNPGFPRGANFAL